MASGSETTGSVEGRNFLFSFVKGFLFTFLDMFQQRRVQDFPGGGEVGAQIYYYHPQTKSGAR